MPALPRTILTALLLAAPATGAPAQPVSHPSLFDAVHGADGVTYADLVRLIVPDLAPAGESHAGSEVVAMRHITAELDDIEPPERIRLDRVAATPVRSGGRDRLALLVDLGASDRTGEGFVVLALYDAAGGPVLLDATNVALDRFTSLLDPARLRVGDGDDLLMSLSTHHNSSQGYATTTLILARDDRLERVDSIFTFDDRHCAFDRIQRLDVAAGDGLPFASIVAIVSEETSATGNDCGDADVPGPPSRSIAVTYRWDAARSRYLPDSDAFEVLARENEARF